MGTPEGFCEQLMSDTDFFAIAAAATAQMMSVSSCVCSLLHRVVGSSFSCLRWSLLQ